MSQPNVFATELRPGGLAGSLRSSDAGKEITVAGWVHRVRNLGGIVFVDLRDRAGLLQVSFNPDWAQASVIADASSLGQEYVVQISGTVVSRPEEMRNADMSTGDVELQGKSLRVLAQADIPAIPVARGKGEKLAAEELRLRHRHLDLRRPELQRNIILRHRLQQTTRRYFDDRGFLEIETPILTKPTPEGARDYLVPSRVHAGEFYALPQSPQLYKQLLMVSGYDRYFQIARCFRDEDLRADRQPEFTQIDVEASFVGQEDIISLTEGLMAALLKDVGIEIPATFQRMAYADAMESYGSDRPDLRYDLKLFDATDAFRSADFAITRSAIDAGGRVRGVRIRGGAALSRKQVDEIELVAKSGGASGLLRVKKQNGALEGPAAKFVSERGAEILALEEGDLALMVAGPDAISSVALDRVRQDAARRMNLVRDDQMELLWVTDFPLFGVDAETGGLAAVHHPFTSPNPEDLSKLESDPQSVRALAYDVILNGTELGGGSIRIHDRETQRRVLGLLGITAEEAQARFGFLLEALSSGAPPHGGIAFGFDRIAMMLAGAQSLRDVIAFPKTTAARALFEGAPSPVKPQDLTDLHLELRSASSD
ncbi:MAG TPA: aspartate--tRNA ligase [Gemmatimonadaceae bacterium]|nr:aspartate--tRNA ligase [Gemmatimonadaceae bacterium]